MNSLTVDGLSPPARVDTNGNAVTWTPITFGASQSVTLPAATVNSTTGTGQPSLTLSDVIPMESFARTDGGVGFLLHTRCLTPAPGGNYDVGIMPTASVFSAYASASNGRFMDSYYAGGDFVSTGQSAITDSTVIQGVRYAYVIGIRFLSATRCVTIMGAGDSLTCGYVTASGFDGFGLSAAVKLSNPGVLGVQ